MVGRGLEGGLELKSWEEKGGGRLCGNLEPVVVSDCWQWLGWGWKLSLGGGVHFLRWDFLR